MNNENTTIQAVNDWLLTTILELTMGELTRHEFLAQCEDIRVTAQLIEMSNPETCRQIQKLVDDAKTDGELFLFETQRPNPEQN